MWWNCFVKQGQVWTFNVNFKPTCPRNPQGAQINASLIIYNSSAEEDIVLYCLQCIVAFSKSVSKTPVQLQFQ